MTNPLDDDSRWTLLGMRFETPQFIIDGHRAMMRETFGDELMDTLEATIPPPYGTLHIAEWEGM